MKPCKPGVLFCVAVFSICAPQRLAAQDPPRSAGFDAAIEAGINVIRKMRAGWKDVVVDPLARRQSTRILNQLSNDIDNLALQKQELGESTELAVTSGDFSRLLSEAEALRDEIGTMRRRLNRLFSFMPDAFRPQAGELESALMQGFSTKWASMNEVAHELNVEHPTAEKSRRLRADPCSCWAG